MLDDKHIDMLSKFVLSSWQLTKAEVQKDLQPYLSFSDEIPIIDGIAVEDRTIILAAL